MGTRKMMVDDVKSEEITIENAFNNFVRFKKSEGLSPKTIGSYIRNFKNFAGFCNETGIEYLSQINKKVIMLYKEYLLSYTKEDGKEMTPQSKNTYLNLVRIFVNYYISEEILPYMSIKLFKVPAKKEVSRYSPEELTKIINSNWRTSDFFVRRRDYAMCMTLMLTGIRRATLVEMRVSDIDFANGILVLRHLKREDTDSLSTVPLNKDLSEVLSYYLGRYSTEGNVEAEYLFPSTAATKMDPDNAYHELKRFFDSAGVEFRGCHEFRRTFATMLFDKNGSYEKTQELMCLKETRVLRRYINVNIEQLKEESERMNLISQLSSGRKIKNDLKRSK